MFKHGFPPEWSTFKKLIWLVGTGIAGAASGVWKTVTGTLIHITDALASPMQKCEVSLEPIQDLHGQDAPYPAGGGKNKLAPATARDTTQGGINIKSNGDGVYVFSGTATGTMNYTVTMIEQNEIKDGDYFHCLNTVANNSAQIVINFSDNSYIVITLSSVGKIQSLSAKVGLSITSLRFYIAATYNATVSPMVVASSSNVPWSPFANICPITGWTGCEVNVTGVNVWDEQYQLGYWDIANGSYHSANTEICSKNYIPVKPDTEYRLVGLPSAIFLLFYDLEKGYLSQQSKSSTFTTPANAYFMHINLGSGYGTTYNNDVSINYPSTDTDYHAYSGTTLSVTFPETVYGGTVDLVSGGKSKMASVDMGTLGWTYNSQYSFFQSNEITDSSTVHPLDVVPNILCSIYKSVANGGLSTLGNLPDMSITQRSTYKGVTVKDARYTDAAAFKTAMSGVQLVYELATPTEISLTPQPISTLKGENNVWSNSNGETTIIYKAQSS